MSNATCSVCGVTAEPCLGWDKRGDGWVCPGCQDGPGYCVICDGDRHDGGEVRNGDWFCDACLASEPCEKCGGEHYHGLACDAVDALYTFDGECPSTFAEFLEANMTMDRETIADVARLPVGGLLVTGGGAEATCEIRRIK